MNPKYLLLALSIALLASACGHTPPATTPEKHMVLDLELVVMKDGALKSFSVPQLFELGSKELADEDYPACALSFDLLEQETKGSDYYVPSAYNAGLCYERQQLWAEAAERYLALIQVAGESRDGLDALFRLAEADANLGQWQRVADNMERVQDHPELKHLDRVEAGYRAGMAYIALRQLDQAKRQFENTIKVNRHAQRARLPNANYFVSGCFYGLALISHTTFSQLRFKLPEEQMKIDMKKKQELAQEAYSQYITTIQKKNHYWAILSGYMVGKLFEDFYYDILSAEIPPHLTDEEVEAYFFALRDELDPLLEKALEAYQKTASTSDRLGVENDWVKLTKERRERLREYMSDQDYYRREEAAIIEWNQELRELEAARAADPDDSDLLVTPPPPPLPVAKPAAPSPVEEH